MAFANRSPIRFAPAVLNSGDPNDGIWRFAQGGQVAGSIYSGALAVGVTAAPGGVAFGTTGHALLCSGAGVLMSVALHNNLLTLSGVAVTFYSPGVANTVARSGGGAALSESGAIILARIGSPGGVSGQISTTEQIPIGMPFANGLFVTMASGAGGFSYSINREASQSGTQV